MPIERGEKVETLLFLLASSMRGVEIFMMRRELLQLATKPDPAAGKNVNLR